MERSRREIDSTNAGSYLESDYRRCEEIDIEVQGLDPLKLDSFLVNKLPSLNDRGNLDEIAGALEEIKFPVKISQLSIPEAMAATRDLAMIASSLRRHNIPFDTMSGLENTLLELSKITQEVPADTVFSYGTRNPDGDRMRTFTNLPEERLFIESFRNGMGKLPQAVYFLETAQGLSIFDPNFHNYIDQARKEFENMVSAIMAVRRAISPELFTNELRPYFEPKNIGGKTYKAPGGAQMPIILIDQVLWGSSQESNPDYYIEYYSENLMYQPTQLREKADVISHKSSIMSGIKSEIEGNAQLTAEEIVLARKSLEAIYELLTFVEKFRHPHLKIAQDNMAIRSTGSVGSGGYDTKILEFLLSQISNSKKQIADMLKSL